MKGFMTMTGAAILILIFASAVSGGSAEYSYDDLHRLTKADYGDGEYVVYDYDDAGNMTEKIIAGAALLSELVGFEASAGDGCVLLEWRTASEPGNAGFLVLRADAADGEYAGITRLIPAQGNAVMGASYDYEDCDVMPGRTYSYRLEDVDLSGDTGIADMTVSVTMPED